MNRELRHRAWPIMPIGGLTALLACGYFAVRFAPEKKPSAAETPLAKHGVSRTTIPYAKMQLNGDGIHCSTMPVVRDPV